MATPARQANEGSPRGPTAERSANKSALIQTVAEKTGPDVLQNTRRNKRGKGDVWFLAA